MLGAWKGCVLVGALMRAYRVGCSILYIASAGGHLSCVEALIREKADVLQCDR